MDHHDADPTTAIRHPLPRVRAALVTLSLTLLIVCLGVAGTVPAHAYANQAIWVGSPVNGTWGSSGYVDTTPNGGHHTLYKADLQNQWSGDLPAAGGSAAVLYVAPSDAAYNDAVTTRITKIIDDNACRYGGGGDMVTVGIYYNGVLYGRATYAHLDRDPSLFEGKPIPRWGTPLGNVATLQGSGTGGDNCWTGPHVHFEMRAETQAACWNKGYSYAGYPVSRTNFLGFVSGPLSGTLGRCP